MSNENLISIKIKTGNHSNDLKLTILSNETLKSLKERIKIELNCHEKFIRLISSGKLLEPDTASLSKLGIREGSFIHAVITSHEPRHNSSNDNQNSSSSSSGTSSSSQLTSNTSTTPVQYRGFDRLTEIGLTIDETAALRSSFQSQIEEFSQGYPQRADEDEHSYRYRIEENWMREQGPTSEFRLNLPRSTSNSSNFNVSLPSFQTIRSVAETSFYEEDTLHSNNGTMKEFIWGVLLGSTLGFLMIFCVWDRNISQRQKVGIMIGITIHMFTGYLQNTTSITPTHSQTLRGSNTLSHSQSSSSSNTPGSSLTNNSNESIEISLDTPAER